MKNILFIILFSSFSSALIGQSAIVELTNVTISGKDVTFQLSLTPSNNTTIYLGNFDVKITFPSGNPVTAATRTVRSTVLSASGLGVPISTSISPDGKSINYQPAAPGGQDDFNDFIAKVSGTVSLGTYKITFTNTPSGVMQCGGTLFYTLAPSGSFLSTLVTTSCLGTASLPLDLLDFSAYVIDESAKPMALLKWKTANEKDVDYYEIQRSLNSVDFTPLSTSHKIVAQNRSLQTYDIVDENPFSGITYYRLKMVDKDGSFQFSGIRSVDLNILKRDSKIRIYPNPTDDNLHVLFTSSASEQAKNYTIFNMLGQVLMQGEMTNSVNTSSLPAGAYLIKIDNDVAQFLKQ